jgi:hypothetical protein
MSVYALHRYRKGGLFMVCRTGQGGFRARLENFGAQFPGQTRAPPSSWRQRPIFPEYDRRGCQLSCFQCPAPGQSPGRSCPGQQRQHLSFPRRQALQGCPTACCQRLARTRCSLLNSFSPWAAWRTAVTNCSGASSFITKPAAPANTSCDRAIRVAYASYFPKRNQS